MCRFSETSSVVLDLCSRLQPFVKRSDCCDSCFLFSFACITQYGSYSLIHRHPQTIMDSSGGPGDSALHAATEVYNFWMDRRISLLKTQGSWTFLRWSECDDCGSFEISCSHNTIDHKQWHMKIIYDHLTSMRLNGSPHYFNLIPHLTKLNDSILGKDASLPPPLLLVLCLLFWAAGVLSFGDLFCLAVLAYNSRVHHGIMKVQLRKWHVFGF